MESGAITGAAVLPDWTQLPEEILVSLMGELGIPDLIRSGAVCASWQSAYAAFRRLRLPSPRQPPYLLYSCDAFGPDAAALYCPSTGATFRVPMPEALPLRSLSPIGSAQGWLVVADDVSNLHLLNPLTGGRVALPPITTLRDVEGGSASLDTEGNLVYTVLDVVGELVPVPVGEARDCMYDQAALSCGPYSHAAGYRACVILLLHSFLSYLSFASPGDERWTWIPPGERTGLRRGNLYHDAAYNDRDGLFYVVNGNGSIYVLDLHGPSAPVARRIIPDLGRHGDYPYRYLVHTPWGDVLQAWRFREEHEPFTLREFTDDDYSVDPSVELCTVELQLYKVDTQGQRLGKLDGVGDHALFIGYNGSLCLPVADFSGLKPNCAYVTDDSSFTNFHKGSKREIGVWDIESQRLQSLGGATFPKEPWLNWPAPTWITPSLL